MPPPSAVDIIASGNASVTTPSSSPPSKHDWKVSIDRERKVTAKSDRRHQAYLDSLICPTREMVERISEIQERREEEVESKVLGNRSGAAGEHGGLDGEQHRARAAGIIQRNYRGHRERRMMDGMSLNPSSRWMEAIKEARYRHLTEPRARAGAGAGAGAGARVDGAEMDGGGGGEGEGEAVSSRARQNWKKVGMIAKRAGGDEDSDRESESEEGEDTPEHEREARRKKRVEQKSERQHAAKMMDLQYFLEMVDLKHRYGSNLRTYHEEWKKSDTHENFFYWLDHGEGSMIDCQGCPRSRLDSEQVRYLSKEERLGYLVKIDKQGRLCWAKNGVRIDTTEQFKDSLHGIVPATDETPAYAPRKQEAATSSDSSSDSDDESARADKYATPELDRSKGVKKVKHVSAATIFNKLLRGSVKKNTWIFVADTSFRLYVGIKQSGSFQHSSFLHGSRISAAGLIKVKDGRLSKLSPLSGHYRPPVSNFRAFVHSLKDAGVDMSHVSISRSYAVLVGLEAYVKSRRRGKNLFKKLIHGRDKLLSPDELAEREEAERDKSESAAKEQRFLEMRQRVEAEDREASRANLHLMDKFHMGSRTPKLAAAESSSASLGQPREKPGEVEIQAPGPGPENAIAPDGTR